MSGECRTILGNVSNIVALSSLDDAAASLRGNAAPSSCGNAAPSLPGNSAPSPLDACRIAVGAKFDTFRKFETKFNEWKLLNRHPFRVASSETLRMPDGSLNERFKYRYIVYHCAHYGSPRMRGIGKRPNQNYMPCGCRAMLRLNYSWTENLLKITTLYVEHTGHVGGNDLIGKEPKMAKKTGEEENLHKNYANLSKGLADDVKSKNHAADAVRRDLPTNYANFSENGSSIAADDVKLKIYANDVRRNLHTNYANFPENLSIGLADDVKPTNYAADPARRDLPETYANEVGHNLHTNYANSLIRENNRSILADVNNAALPTYALPITVALELASKNLVSPTTMLLMRQFIVKNNRAILSQAILEELRQSLLNLPSSLNGHDDESEFRRAMIDLKNLAAFYRSRR